MSTSKGQEIFALAHDAVLTITPGLAEVTHANASADHRYYLEGLTGTDVTGATVHVVIDGDLVRFEALSGIDAHDIVKALREFQHRINGDDVPDEYGATYYHSNSGVIGIRQVFVMIGLLAVVLILGSVVIPEIREAMSERSEASSDLGSQGDSGSSSIRSVSVEYVVRGVSLGSGSFASITWSNGQGGTEQQTSARIPWRRTFTMQAGSSVSIVAQNMGRSPMIACEIYVDGESVRESTSWGEFSVVTCSGLIGD